ncbi:hypothetical protein LWI29_017075 [Acer saccharum]|uniref:Uncharacterized protein n=1 Tax=Acer saccharum TaxID=4024 RepID=A0AA39SD06_ACESA|nr:hypothetical protein LWI29_017075 [Acer saccharum]
MDMSKGTKSISAYLQHAKSLSDSLAAICELVSSNDLVTAVLHGLGSDYAMIVTAILNFPPLPRFKDLRACLLSYESQLQRTKPTDTSTTTTLIASHSSSPTANMTHGSSYGRGQSRGGRNGRRSNFRGRGRSPWHSALDYSTFGSSHGNYWPQQNGNGGRGLLGVHPSPTYSPQWCSACSTPQHSVSNCPHRYHGPESLTAPFTGMHVAQYPSPPDFTWYPNTGATHHMTSSAPPDSVRLLHTGAAKFLSVGNIGTLPTSYATYCSCNSISTTNSLATAISSSMIATSASRYSFYSVGAPFCSASSCVRSCLHCSCLIGACSCPTSSYAGSYYCVTSAGSPYCSTVA